MKNLFTKIIYLIIPLAIFSCNLFDDVSSETITLKPYLLPSSGGFSYGIGTCVTTGNSCYGFIDGFEFKWGFTQKIEVERREIANPPEDGSSVEFTLLEIIESTEDEVGAIYTLENLNVIGVHEDNVFSENTNDEFLYINKIFECDFAADCDGLITAQKERDRINVKFEYTGNSNIKLISWY